jgi:hypothetical protein
MITNLIECENHSLGLDAVVIPSGLDIRRSYAYSDAGSPDCVLPGAILWPEYSLGSVS